NVHPKDGFEYLSVGWLGDEVTLAGDTDPVVLLALQRLSKTNQLPDSWRGKHICGVCFRNAPPPLLDEMGWIGARRTVGNSSSRTAPRDMSYQTWSITTLRSTGTGSLR